MDNRTLFETKRWFLSALQPMCSMHEAEQLWRILLEDRFGIDRVTALSRPEFLLDADQSDFIKEAVCQLRRNKPIQYIIGAVPFMGMRLKVTESVLIPRPETEEMVRCVIESCSVPPQRVWDVGTGSGCIALALKKAFPFAEVLAFDISSCALEVARTNAESNRLEVGFIKEDILNAESDVFLQPVDLIVSNPPYVCRSERDEMQPNVLDWEPEQALFVSDTDPLVYYRTILRIARKRLTASGALWFEINEMMGKNMRRLCRESGFDRVEVCRDFREKDRFVVCRK